MEDNSANYSPDRIEVLGLWGYVDTTILEENGITIPKELKELDQVNVNAWICNNQILRLVLNPFKSVRIPYYVCHTNTILIHFLVLALLRIWMIRRL